MFCSNCGNAANPTQPFCSFCGAPLRNTPPVQGFNQAQQPPFQGYNNTPQQPSINNYNQVFVQQAPAAPAQPAASGASGNGIIRHISCASRGRLCLWPVIGGIIDTILGIMFLAMGVVTDPHPLVYVISGPFVTFIGARAYSLYQKRFCTLKDDSICGVTSGYHFNLVNETYDVKYSDIVSVKSGFGKQIIIHTKYGQKYRLYLPKKDHYFALGILQQKVGIYN